MFRLRPSLLACLIFAVVPGFATEAPATVYDVRTLGAVGDGTTLNTKALQAAIDQCSIAGGGTVLLSGGTYLTGTLYLKSNVTLHLDAGATLLASGNIADYPTDTHRTMYKDEKHMDRCFLFARDAQNIAIEGRGVIDGQGKLFPNAGDPVKNRPMLVRFLNCSGLRLRDIALRNPASWTSAWLYCRDVAIDSVTFHSRANINGDGLDFDGCEGVRVSNSTFDNSDDCICLQTSLPDKPCRDIAVTNCNFTSRWAGMRIGLLSRGNFENVTVTNCTFRDIRDSGIKIQMGEGAVMKNLVFSNLVMKNVLKPVFMTLTQHRAAADAPEEFAPIGRMRGFLFSNIMVETETGGKDAAFIITGLPGHPIEDVTFADIRATFAGGGTAAHSANPVSELTSENLKGRWPEYSRFDGTVPAYGFYARHIKGLTVRNAAFGTLAPDARPAVAFTDVQDADTTGAPAAVQLP
jgi:polygalacturonase